MTPTDIGERPGLAGCIRELIVSGTVRPAAARARGRVDGRPSAITPKTTPAGLPIEALSGSSCPRLQYVPERLYPEVGLSAILWVSRWSERLGRLLWLERIIVVQQGRGGGRAGR